MDAMMQDGFNTDAELVKAFEETDDDMKIMEDPIPCIVDHGTCLFPCTTCGRLFYSKEALEHHEKEYHVEEKNNGIVAIVIKYFSVMGIKYSMKEIASMGQDHQENVLCSSKRWRSM